MIECPRCSDSFGEEDIPSVEPVVCPKCGYRFSPLSIEDLEETQNLNPNFESNRSFTLIWNYFLEVWQIITQPKAFFQLMPLSGGLNRPLVFALVTHWLGSALHFIWRLLLGASPSQRFRFFFSSSSIDDVDTMRHFYPWQNNGELLQLKNRVIEWFTGAGPVIADPFSTLVSILFMSFLLFIAARLFVSPGKGSHPEEITYESAVRIICYGMSPALLAGIPWVGGFLAPILTLLVTIIGTREVYRISTGLAIVIALFPKLLIPAIIGIGILLFIFFVAKVLFTAF